MESLQGALDELKVEKSRMQQAHENQLQEIQRLNSVQGEKSSLLAELQEVRGSPGIALSTDSRNSADFKLPKGGQWDLCKSTEKFNIFLLDLHKTHFITTMPKQISYF